MKKRIITIAIALNLIQVPLLASNNHFISVAETNDDIHLTEYYEVEKNGVIPDGDAYKKLDFYTGEAQLNNISNLPRSLPTYVDLSTDPCFPNLGNQGNLGSCVGFATTYYQFSYEVNKLNGVTSTADREVYSPKWTYNFINGGDDDGASITNALLVLKNYGALKLSDLPYDSNYTWIPGNVNISSNEMIPEKLEALETRISSCGSSSLPNSGTFITSPTDSDLNVIKALLNSGKVLSTTTITSFDYKNGVDRNNTSIKVNYRCHNGGGGHAMAVVGYDDNVWCDVNNNGIAESCEKGAFKLANSYGSSGVSNDTNGYKWVLYDAINAVSANNVNSWENNFSTTRIQALRNETNQPTFWYISVDNFQVNYVGEIELNTGNDTFSGCQFKIGRAPVGSNTPTYSSNNMLPTINGSASYCGKLFFDYDSLCSPISNYLSGYKWYVKFYSLNGTYNLQVIDNLENPIANYGNNNSTYTKNVIINTMYGDLNYSGNLSSDDASMIQAYQLQLKDFSTLQLELADCNHDGIISLADAAYILQHSN